MKYSTDVKNRRLQVVIDAIGVGGFLKIGTAGMRQTLANIALPTPAFREPVDGMMSMNSELVSDPSAAADGKAMVGQITTASGRVVIDEMSVGEEGAAIVIASQQISKGQEVRVKSGTILHA